MKRFEFIFSINNQPQKILAFTYQTAEECKERINNIIDVLRYELIKSIDIEE